MPQAETNSVNSRAEASRIVGLWLQTGEFPDRLMESVKANRPFVMEVVYGSIKRKRTLDWIIARFASRKPSSDIVPFLDVGLYQLFFMDSVAAYAAVNETVEAVTTSGRAKAAGFVNAILRRALRESDDIRKALSAAPVAVRESHPDILVERWEQLFGKEKASALCSWNNGKPEVAIHPFAGRTTLKGLLAEFEKAGVEATPHPADPDSFIALPRGVDMRSLPGYAEGLFSAHDPSTNDAVALLDPKPGEFVLDACAAPGGKTILMAERMKGQGRLFAMDVQAERITVLEENIKRMRLASVRTGRGDAANAKDLRRASSGRVFDKILLDVPCTNTGVLRRRPDARWRFSANQLSNITSIQRTILDKAAEVLSPQGRLVYSTCSLEPEEDESMIKSWIASHKSYQLVAETKRFPPEAGTDGTYAAALEVRH